MYIYVYMRADGKEGWSFVPSVFLRFVLQLFCHLVVFSLCVHQVYSFFSVHLTSRVRYSLEHTCLDFFFFGSGDCDNRPTCSNLPIVRPSIFFLSLLSNSSVLHRPDQHLMQCYLGTNI